MEATVVVRLCSFILALLLSGIALAQPVPFSGPNVPTAYDARLFGAKCDGTTDDSAALTAMDSAPITQIGIYSTCRLSNNVTLTHGLYVGKQGALSIDGGKVLTLSGSLASDATTPFTGAGAAKNAGGVTIAAGPYVMAPNNRSIMVQGGGTFQVGGPIGPIAYGLSTPGFEDSYNIQAQPGALPSTDTTNLVIWPSVPGGKSFINFPNSAAAVPNEERFILGFDGSSYILANTVTGMGVSRNLCVLDGKGPEVTACFRPRSGGGSPDILLGPGVPVLMSNVAHSGESALILDVNSNLVIGQGGNIKSIIFDHPLISVGSSPALSACGAAPSIISGTDTKGLITIGTGGPTACTVTFAAAYSTTPAITLTGLGSGATVFSASTASPTAFTISGNGADLSSKSVMYHVIQ